MKNKKPTVTVGIPAYNEEKNIGRLLKSINVQKHTYFTLENIIVLSDGSTDKTVSVAKNISRGLSKVKIITGHSRKGKAARLNEIYELNNSDILITLDADVFLATPSELDKVLRLFVKYPKLLICSLRNIPVNQKGFIGKISNASFFLWQEAAKVYKNGSNIHTVLGSSTAFRKELADAFRYPYGIIADQGYLYIKANKMRKNSYKYIDNANVYFKAVSNLKDYLSQGTRAIHSDKNNIVETFGKGAILYYKIPFRYKFAAVVKRLLIDPVFTSLAIILAIFIRLFPKPANTKAGLWEIAVSSK
ncbi:glycosyltransferase family 2 protein [Candidatus Gottesmanbacteria bacterium]|nr:glycosyltransferase family 2 protein [Candidatus Gottesmanbacteria bacterium]